MASAEQTSAADLPACLDGEVMPAGVATISVLDDGFVRGDGAFEVIRVYAGRPYALGAHFERLRRSAKNLVLEFDADALEADVERLLAARAGHDGHDGLLRLIVTRGGRRIALLEPLPVHPDSVRLGFVTYSPTRVLDGVKSLSYAANMLAGRRAQARGFDEALLVTPHGRVLETPTASFFWVRDGELCTPPLDDHILVSITRADVCALMGAQERPCPRDELDDVEEAFIASTVREVLPVAAIETRELALPGPITVRAAAALREHIVSTLATGAAS